MISGLKYSVHNEHKKTRNFVKEWGFANLGDPMYILGGKQGFMLVRLMGLIGLFSQAVSVGCYKGSLGDMGLVGRGAWGGLACLRWVGRGELGSWGMLGDIAGLPFLGAGLSGWGPGPWVRG